MSDFMTDAQELLNDTDYAEIKALAVKVAQFQSTKTEDDQFLNIKQKVNNRIAQRDKEKNLQFLSGGAFTIGEVIRVMFQGKDQKDVVKAVRKGLKEVYPDQVSGKTAVHIADYKDGDTVHELHMYSGIKGRNDALKALVNKGAVSGLVKHLTAEGKAWITKSHVATAGPYAGKAIYKNLNDVATKYKWSSADLKKALKITD